MWIGGVFLQRRWPSCLRRESSIVWGLHLTRPAPEAEILIRALARGSYLVSGVTR